MPAALSGFLRNRKRPGHYPHPLSTNHSSMLVLGTANRKKGIELTGLLRPVGAELRTLADFPGDFQVAEDGDTFAANARLKAAGYARLLGQWVLADDSGLAVERPGRPAGGFFRPLCRTGGHRHVEQPLAVGGIGR